MFHSLDMHASSLKLSCICRWRLGPDWVLAIKMYGKTEILSVHISETKHLDQSSLPQIVPAVWERDQRPAEKWFSQIQTSRTGDAASVLKTEIEDMIDPSVPNELYNNLTVSRDYSSTHISRQATYKID